MFEFNWTNETDSVNLWQEDVKLVIPETVVGSGGGEGVLGQSQC